MFNDQEERARCLEAYLHLTGIHWFQIEVFYYGDHTPVVTLDAINALRNPLLSSGEQAIARLFMAIWNGGAKFDVHDLLQLLDHKQQVLVLELLVAIVGGATAEYLERHRVWA